MCNVYVKVYKAQGYVLVAVCDEELLGRTFVDGDLCLNVSEKFYKGLKICVDDAIDLVRKADTANLVGAKIVDKAKQERLVHPEAVINIAGIPHAQIVKV